MLWPARSALSPVPQWAVVGTDAIDMAEASIGDQGDLDAELERAHEELVMMQPGLTLWLHADLHEVRDETAEALGRLLLVLVYRSFVSAFGQRLHEVDEATLVTARATFEYDEEHRRGSPVEVLETDDMVAMGQPHLVAFVREQVEAATEADEDGDFGDIDLDDVAAVYRAVLLEVIALGQAVDPPRGTLVPERMKQ